jgi:hypothetical protein
LLDVLQNLVEGGVVALRRQDVEALNEGKTGVDHGRELTHEDDELFLGNGGADGNGEALALLLHFHDGELLRFQARRHHLGGVRLHDALANFTGSRARFPSKLSHGSSEKLP